MNRHELSDVAFCAKAYVVDPVSATKHVRELIKASTNEEYKKTLLEIIEELPRSPKVVETMNWAEQTRRSLVQE